MKKKFSLMALAAFASMALAGAASAATQIASVDVISSITDADRAAYNSTVAATDQLMNGVVTNNTTKVYYVPDAADKLPSTVFIGMNLKSTGFTQAAGTDTKIFYFDGDKALGTNIDDYGRIDVAKLNDGTPAKGDLYDGFAVIKLANSSTLSSFAPLSKFNVSDGTDEPKATVATGPTLTPIATKVEFKDPQSPDPVYALDMSRTVPTNIKFSFVDPKNGVILDDSKAKAYILESGATTFDGTSDTQIEDKTPLNVTNGQTTQNSNLQASYDPETGVVSFELPEGKLVEDPGSYRIALVVPVAGTPAASQFFVKETADGPWIAVGGAATVANDGDIIASCDILIYPKPTASADIAGQQVITMQQGSFPADVVISTDLRTATLVDGDEDTHVIAPGNAGIPSNVNVLTDPNDERGPTRYTEFVINADRVTTDADGNEVRYCDAVLRAEYLNTLEPGTHYFTVGGQSENGVNINTNYVKIIVTEEAPAPDPGNTIKVTLNTPAINVGDATDIFITTDLPYEGTEHGEIKLTLDGSAVEFKVVGDGDENGEVEAVRMVALQVPGSEVSDLVVGTHTFRVTYGEKSGSATLAVAPKDFPVSGGSSGGCATGAGLVALAGLGALALRRRSK